MHTKDRLAQALSDAGLNEMALKAAQGFYHDYLSPLAQPEMQLDADLIEAGTPAATELRKRHHNGDFDASAEESEAWAASSDGQDTMRQLIRNNPHDHQSIGSENARITQQHHNFEAANLTTKKPGLKI